MSRVFAGRVALWSLGLGIVGALLGIKGATVLDAADWRDIGVFFVGGCAFGCLIGLLTTAYNEKR